MKWEQRMYSNYECEYDLIDITNKIGSIYKYKGADAWCSSIKDERTEDILNATTLEEAKHEFLERYYNFCEGKINDYRNMMDCLIEMGV